jgi:glutaredoxin
MFYVYSLKHCPYSISAVDILERSGLRYKNIMIEAKDKKKYCKKNKMNTFPQVFYKKNKKMYKRILGLTSLVAGSNAIDLQFFDGLLFGNPSADEHSLLSIGGGVC